MPATRTKALFAVIELITIVVQSDTPSLDIDDEVARIDVVSGLGTDLDHRPTLEDDLPKYLAHLSRAEKASTASNGFIGSHTARRQRHSWRRIQRRGEFVVHADKALLQPWTKLKDYSPVGTHASLFALGVCNMVFECNIFYVTFQNNVTT